jgi:hypothetical protein
MGTDCSARTLVFGGFAGRQVVRGFDGGDVTSNGGAPLLREADRAIGLTTKMARCFRDERNPAFVEHRLETLLAQRIPGIALGYEDLNDHDEPRFDPALALLSDTLRPRREEPEPGQRQVATLTGKPTLNRLEHGLLGGRAATARSPWTRRRWRRCSSTSTSRCTSVRPSASSSTSMPPTIAARQPGGALLPRLLLLLLLPAALHL